jgi:endoglucanase
MLRRMPVPPFLPTPTRRRLLAAPLLLLPGPARAVALPEAAPGLSAAWAQFRGRFMRPEGRVVDTGNGGVSHSEGQGWALLAAERCGDREAFAQLLDWTERNLHRPQDSLFAWRHVPGARPQATDRNNAADGDLFIAGALLLAARRWGLPRYEEQGTAIARDILRLLLRRVAGRTVLLPGLVGFETAEHVILNPSYYAFPMIRLAAQAAPDPAWLRLVADGLGLLRGARFGRWALPPDWLQLRRADGVASLPASRPPRFSYDALRVPLYLGWAGLQAEPAGQAVQAFWNDPVHARLPAWADLATDSVSPYAADGGIAALRRWVTWRAQPAGRAAPVAVLEEGDQYYPAMLKILTMLAQPVKT